MRIGIIGIGGVGGYFGGKLAIEYEGSDQHDIIFIARGEHLKAIQEKGLQLFCTKSYSLESSAQQFSSCIDKNTVVIPLLNGVNSAERLRAVLLQTNVLSGSVYIITHIEKPGVIHQEDGACILTFGTDDESAKKYQYILDILLQAKINAILTDKISEVLWTKYLLMCPLASLMSATNKTYGAVWADSSLRKKATDMMLEVAAVAKARHVFLPDNAVDKSMEMVAGFGHNSKTSMQLDREKGRQTEIDALTAYLCKEGRESGVPTPLHDEVYAQLIK